MLDEIVIPSGSSIKAIENIRKQNFPDTPRAGVKIFVERRGDDMVILMRYEAKHKRQSGH